MRLGLQSHMANVAPHESLAFFVRVVGKVSLREGDNAMDSQRQSTVSMQLLEWMLARNPQKEICGEKWQVGVDEGGVGLGLGCT